MAKDKPPFLMTKPELVAEVMRLGLSSLSRSALAVLRKGDLLNMITKGK